MLSRDLHSNVAGQLQTPDTLPASPSTPANTLQHPFTFEIHATLPPLGNSPTIMQRADEVNAIQRMLTDAQTSAVMLVGAPGAGKSTLASLLFHRLLLAQQAGLPVPRYLTWLTVGPHTTIPHLLSAILNSVDMSDPAFFLLSAEQQLTTLLRVLRRPQENAFIVLDHFESLLHPETHQDAVGRGALSLFLELLQTEIGTSRFLLTSYESPYDENMEETRVRTCLISRISLPEGVLLLQQRGIQAPPEALSLVWQRCAGHVFALVLLSALVRISGLSLHALLADSQYQSLWSGEVTLHLVAAVYHYLSPIQYVIMRALTLFNEPVPIQAITATVTGGNDRTPSSSLEKALDILTQLALVQSVTDASEQHCYTLHPLMRHYVLEHYLEGSDLEGGFALSLGVGQQQHRAHNPEAQQVALAAGHMQVARYYYTLAQRYCPPREQRKGLEDIVPLVAVVRHLCLGWHWQDACDLLFRENLYETMVQWGAWDTLIGLYTALLPPFGSVQRKDEALLNSQLGMLYGRQGDLEQSQRYYSQALAIQRELGNRHGEATILTNQGELFRMHNEWEKARTNFEQALILNRQEQNPLLQCITLHDLGLLYHNAKEYQSAQSYYRAALKLAYNLSQPSVKPALREPASRNRGIIFTNLGILLYEQKQLPVALALLLAALQLGQTLRDPGVSILERFLTAIEQKMGTSAYDQLRQEALRIQQQVIASYVA